MLSLLLSYPEKKHMLEINPLFDTPNKKNGIHLNVLDRFSYVSNLFLTVACEPEFFDSVVTPRAEAKISRPKLGSVVVRKQKIVDGILLIYCHPC